MFRKISLKNYRTHKSTQIELGPVTLLIGNNNSGKSNLLAGIRHFSQLVARAWSVGLQGQGSTEEGKEEVGEILDVQSGRAQLRPSDLFPHRHRLAQQGEPMAFNCSWTHRSGEVEYAIELYEKSKQKIFCRERIRFRVQPSDSWQEVAAGWEKPLDRLELRAEVERSPNLGEQEKELCRRFFRDMAQAFAYHLQPSFLKGEAKCDWPKVDPEHLVIPSQLGYEGGNLQEILLHAREKEERTFQRFIASLRRFDRNFHGIRKDNRRERAIWEFDLGRDTPGQLDEFPPEVVSDGLMKAAAIALLTSVPHPPPLILLEEIENGVNPGNIQEFMGWLWRAAGLPDADERGYATQFILTSHSPSVLREFCDHLEHVYTVRLDRHGFKSDVRNLSAALDFLIGIGTVEGEIEERDGKRVVRLPRYKLAELWYGGAIG